MNETDKIYFEPEITDEGVRVFDISKIQAQMGGKGIRISMQGSPEHGARLAVNSVDNEEFDQLITQNEILIGRESDPSLLPDPETILERYYHHHPDDREPPAHVTLNYGVPCGADYDIGISHQNHVAAYVRPLTRRYQEDEPSSGKRREIGALREAGAWQFDPQLVMVDEAEPLAAYMNEKKPKRSFERMKEEASILRTAHELHEYVTDSGLADTLFIDATNNPDAAPNTWGKGTIKTNIIIQPKNFIRKPKFDESGKYIPSKPMYDVEGKEVSLKYFLISDDGKTQDEYSIALADFRPDDHQWMGIFASTMTVEEWDDIKTMLDQYTPHEKYMHLSTDKLMGCHCYECHSKLITGY